METQVGNPADQVTPAPAFAGVPAKAEKRVFGVRRAQLAIGAAVSVALLWGAWATRVLIDLQHHNQPIVKVGLENIVAEYVHAAARSGQSSEQATGEMTNFLKTLNGVMAQHTRGGQVILLSNAVVAGDLPDISNQVRAEIYSKVAMPQASAPQGSIFSPQGGVTASPASIPGLPGVGALGGANVGGGINGGGN